MPAVQTKQNVVKINTWCQYSPGCELLLEIEHTPMHMHVDAVRFNHNSPTHTRFWYKFNVYNVKHLNWQW